MLRWIPLLLVVGALVELFLLIELGRLIGLGPTIGLMILTALLGSAMARFEGLRVLKQWITSIRSLESPTQPLLEGMLILVGGGLLILPGVLTDLAGVSILFPPTRRLWVRPLRRAVDAYIARGAVRLVSISGRTRRSPGDGVVDTTGESVSDSPESRQAPRLH